MITQISFDKVASYKTKTSLETDKKVNIIYGLNGSGKSTFSNYLYNPNNPKYQHCSHTNDDCKVLVYNQKFIQENFYAKDTISGIFSLSKENKEAREKIGQIDHDLEHLTKESESYQSKIDEQNHKVNRAKESAHEDIWNIKKSYSGGDRVLEFCLERLMGKKETLFNYLLSIPLAVVKPQKTIEQLKEEVAMVDGDKAISYSTLHKISLTELSEDEIKLLKEVIIGNENSAVSTLIMRLKNSDWVSNGLRYLDEIEDDTCPFCQSNTMTADIVKQIKDYFDETYEESKRGIASVYEKYQQIVRSLPNFDIYKASPFSVDSLTEMTSVFSSIVDGLKSNLVKVEKKKQTPSIQVELDDVEAYVLTFNSLVDTVNSKINIHNQKIVNSVDELKKIKKEFWQIVRYEYDQTIKGYNTAQSNWVNEVSKLKTDKSNVDARIVKLSLERVEYQKQTINIEESVGNINKGLIDIGITDFYIERYEEDLYRLIRSDSSKSIFSSLSEGEKMIISFLYFKELFKGKQTADEVNIKKIAVIDDPVSSLSHIFVYNIGQLIKNDFFNSDNLEQVFVLTHSLYFFYELVDSKHDRRKSTQSLFRLSKNTKGTTIETMKYEEVQNDYQSYWSVINDEHQPPALIANCMRNVVEYFFNFVQKADLSNVVQKPELQEPKYQAFIRYINRESHSLGQNIFDFKEFDYGAFKEGLRLIFKETGYPEHYEKMSQI